MKSPENKGNIFNIQWEKMVKIITDRDDFHDNLLDQLSILCDLYQEYHELSEFIKKNGYSLDTEGRYGTQLKKRPEVEQRNKTLQEIRFYSKILGLVSSNGNHINPKDEENDWL